jgi:(p)ppGpp synthase/HD superfamily hydrolase
MTQTVEFNVAFESAIRFMVENFPVSTEDSRKPVLFHDIRVGVYLYENGYDEEIVLAGLLHDAIEWSGATAEMVEEKFGKRVLELILANSMDDSIEDAEKKTEELIKRCVNAGQEALIIKTADILDSYGWYTAQKKDSQLEYCKRNAEAILKFKPEDFDDTIFGELKKYL